MAPNPTDGSKLPTFSEKEIQVLAMAWQCMDIQPKVDTDKLAVLTHYTPGSAKKTFGNIKSKLRELALACGTPPSKDSGNDPAKSSTESDSQAKPAGKPKTPRKKAAGTVPRSRKSKSKLAIDRDAASKAGMDLPPLHEEEEPVSPRKRKLSIGDHYPPQGSNSAGDKKDSVPGAPASPPDTPSPPVSPTKRRAKPGTAKKNNGKGATESTATTTTAHSKIVESDQPDAIPDVEAGKENTLNQPPIVFAA